MARKVGMSKRGYVGHVTKGISGQGKANAFAKRGRVSKGGGGGKSESAYKSAKNRNRPA